MLFDFKDLHFESSAGNFKLAQKDVKKHMASFANDEPLYFVCKLLLGDIGAFKQAAYSLSRQWYEILPAFIIFAKPTAEYKDLGPLSSVIFYFFSFTDSF